MKPRKFYVEEESPDRDDGPSSFAICTDRVMIVARCHDKEDADFVAKACTFYRKHLCDKAKVSAAKAKGQTP